MDEKLKFLKTKDAAIEKAVQEFNKAINKAYRKIEKQVIQRTLAQ